MTVPAPRSGGPVDLAACRRPRKRAFPTRADAQVWLADRPHLLRQGNEAYRCPCGRWHTGRPRPRRRTKGRRRQRA